MGDFFQLTVDSGQCTVNFDQALCGSIRFDVVKANMYFTVKSIGISLYQITVNCTLSTVHCFCPFTYIDAKNMKLLHLFYKKILFC